jgi:hypothetical protein
LDFFLFYVRYSTLLHLPPSDSTVSEDAGIEPRTVATTTIHMKTEKERQVADRGLAVGGVVESQMDHSKHRVPECPFFRRNRFLRPSPPVSVSPLGPKRGEQHSLAGEGVGWGDPIPTTRQKAWHSVYSVSQITVGSTFFTFILVLLSCQPPPPPPFYYCSSEVMYL